MMGWISYAIQVISQPINLSEFLLRHTQMTILFGFIFAVVIVRRFSYAGIAFIVIYELSKYYIFGQRFLAEAYIVYPMAYMAGLVFLNLQKEKVFPLEYIASAIFTWFVIFSREPYTLAALFSFAVLLWKPANTTKKLAIIAFFALTACTLFLLPISDYLFNIVTVSYSGVLKGEASGSVFGSYGIIKSIFYPLYILISGKWNEFRILLIGLSATFLILFGYIFIKKKDYMLLLGIVILLALANIRVVEPGTVFYEAFHMIPWYGIFLLLTFLMLFSYAIPMRLRLFCGGIVVVAFLAYLIHPYVFFKNPSDRHEELLMNYGKTMQIGEGVRLLSEPSNTFFIDNEPGADLAYRQSKRISPYKYSWYSYIAPGVKEYRDARIRMFLETPPDFYYGDIGVAIRSSQMPIDFVKMYQLVYPEEKSASLYIKRDIAASISDEKWQKAGEIGLRKQP